MKAARLLLSAGYILCNVCCGVFYLVYGGNMFGEAIVGAGGLVVLIAGVVLAVATIRGRHAVRGTEKITTVFLAIMHFVILLCWLSFFAWEWAGIFVHGALLMLSGGYLYFLIRESGTSAFQEDYDFRPWEMRFQKH